MRMVRVVILIKYDRMLQQGLDFYSILRRIALQSTQTLQDSGVHTCSTHCTTAGF